MKLHGPPLHWGIYHHIRIGASLNNTPPSYGRERGWCQGEWRDGAITQGYQQVIAGLRGGAGILVAPVKHRKRWHSRWSGAPIALVISSPGHQLMSFHPVGPPKGKPAPKPVGNVFDGPVLLAAPCNKVRPLKLVTVGVKAVP